MYGAQSGNLTFNVVSGSDERTIQIIYLSDGSNTTSKTLATKIFVNLC